MSRTILFFLLVALTGRLIFAQEVIRCVHGNSKLTPSQLERIEQEEKELVSFQKSSFRLSEENVYTIPVVVHIVYFDNTQNFTDAQVQSQIDVLNEDFRMKNADLSETPSGFVPDIGDASIEFVLAKRDPEGNATNGITRTKTSQSSFSYGSEDVKHTNRGGHDAWDPTSYLNIWVCNLASGTSKVIGYVPYPLMVGSADDGVAISYTAFGTSGSLNPKYTLGRTATHEIGHWLNLLHLWGDPASPGCTTDYVDDTPPQEDGTNSNLNCPTYPYLKPNGDACNNDPSRGRMWCNFLDYTRDQCMSMFSKGQVSRMTAYLTMSRPSILSSPALNRNDLAITGIQYDSTKNCGKQTAAPTVNILNLGLDTARAFDLLVTINGAVSKISWNGFLPASKDTLLQLTNYSFGVGKNQIKAKVALASPLPDQDSSNDSMVYRFTCPLERDLSVIDLNYDVNQDCLSETNEVKVKIRNKGSERIQAYALKYYLNDTLRVEKQWRGVLEASDDTIWRVNNGPFLGGKNNLKAKVILLDPAKDQNVSNDSLVTNIECASPLSIYPNPASNYMYLKGNDPQIELVILYSAEGKEVLRADYSKSIDISSLRQGLYIVTFVTKEERIRYELVIVR